LEGSRIPVVRTALLRRRSSWNKGFDSLTFRSIPRW